MSSNPLSSRYADDVADDFASHKWFEAPQVGELGAGRLLKSP